MSYKNFAHSLRTSPGVEMTFGKYIIRFAKNDDDLDRVFKLRYEIFNLELKEGLEASHITQRDIDEYDEQFHHLLVEDLETHEIVGTYRMQTQENALDGRGFYSDRQFHLEQIPQEVLSQTVEVGRACIAKNFRNGKVLFCLWRGFSLYLSAMNKTHLIGCGSFTGQDPSIARQAEAYFLANGHLHEKYLLEPREAYFLDYREGNAESPSPIIIPPMIAAYLKYQVTICSKPCVDREFNTIDFVLFLDTRTLSAKAKRIYFGL